MAISASEIKRLLSVSDYDGIIGLSKNSTGVMRFLISMTYDKGGPLWPAAIEAIGLVGAEMPPEKARAVIQRVLWMMRDESGGNAWSGPEIIGEIIARTPEPFMDIVPILVSFHEEDFFRAGVLRAMTRIAQARAELMRPFLAIAEGYLDSPDPEVRGNAAVFIEKLRN